MQELGSLRPQHLLLLLSLFYQCLSQVAHDLGIALECLGSVIKGPLQEYDIALVRFYAIFHEGQDRLLLVLGLICRLKPALRGIDMALQCLYTIREDALCVLYSTTLHIKSALRCDLRGFIPGLVYLLHCFEYLFYIFCLFFHFLLFLHFFLFFYYLLWHCFVPFFVS